MKQSEGLGAVFGLSIIQVKLTAEQRSVAVSLFR